MARRDQLFDNRKAFSVCYLQPAMLLTSRRAIALGLGFFTLWGTACVTGRASKPDTETLKPRIEDFHLRSRWRDYRGAAELLVTERRAPFLKARSVKNDEKDLSITDYQLEECTFSNDGARAECISNISWIRLPSPSESRATVTSVFVWDGSNWYLAQQDEGPFAAELSMPYKLPEPVKP